MSNTPPSLTVAVLGTGLIGAPVARNLARKGFKVRAWNRSASKAQALKADGIEAFPTPAEAVTGADVIVTVLKDGLAARAVAEAALPNLRKGTVWLQLGTVGPEAISSLAAFADENGIVLYDAPVQGTRQPAEQGQLVILASGPETTRGIAEAIFDSIGKKTFWLSEQPGVSSRLKLALNAFVFALTHGTAESLAVAKALEVDPALVVEVIRGGVLDSGYFQAKATAILKNDYATSFSVSNGAKDAKLVVDALASTGVRLDLAAAGLARFQRAIDAGHGDKDIAASFLA